MSYLIRRAETPVDLTEDFSRGAWAGAAVIEINNFRKESSEHHPEVECKLIYDDKGFYIRYQVKDRYVRAVHTNFQDSVCLDSCVEFFVEPDNKSGYFNFEMNCGGTLLLYHVIDNTRTPGGFADYRILEDSEISGMKIYHSLPKQVEPEITEKVDWSLAAFIPFEIFKCVPRSGSVWRANFYKCGDKTSHPHWASWNPVSVLNFHLPECFGEIIFE